MNQPVVDTINDVRELFLSAIAELPEIASFASLLQTSAGARNAFEPIARVARSPRVSEPCDGRITTAIIGSSGHGKTTIMAEMFPGLARRGWLVTDVTDTTGQSLFIRYAEDDRAALEPVVVRSWDVEQIKALMTHPDVARQNETDNIQVVYLENGVAVDGSDATFKKEDLKTFRFPRKTELVPFPEPYRVPPAQAADPRFIRGLTVKEPSAVLRTEPLLKLGGRSYDVLQLRAVVRSVSLHDTFEEIERWTGRDPSDLRILSFVDTPGLATPGNTKDEVLRHFLERKANHVVLDLWKNDELDVIVHLVLCGRSSDFATLWKEIERECGPAEIADLAERLVLAVNGMNVYFTNRDIRAKYEDPAAVDRDGDQFAVTIEDNILQKMSPRGTVRPAKTVFLDSKSIVETLTARPYEEAYAKFRPLMEAWAKPGGVGYETLERLGLAETFEENIAALADPNDRGQGFLVRKLVELIEEKGPALLLRKHVVRSGLLGAIVELKELVGSYYDEAGHLNREAVREALKACLGFLDSDELGTIDKFAARRIDPIIDGVLTRGRSERFAATWVRDAFFATCAAVKRTILEESEHGRVPGEVASEFFRHFDLQVTNWVERWGYQDARLVGPDKGFASTADLVTHCLKLHAREILYQLLCEGEDEDDLFFDQTPKDRQQIRDLMGTLERARDLAVRTCAEHGVSP